jgi:putative SOS response-associated peptidase YedK
MCGRFALAASPGDLIEEFAITVGYNGPTLPADWNIAPTRPIYMIKAGTASSSPSNQPARELTTVSWGLIAPWAKDRESAIKSQSQAINARTETVHEKPTFRNAFRSRRCLIPATGYYEWATEHGDFPPKQPFYIHAHESGNNSSTSNRNNKNYAPKQLLFAGIYDSWVDANGEIFESAAIITREAVGKLAPIHHRMPTFLPADRWDTWLNPELRDVDAIRALLDFPDPTSMLQADPVSTRVNFVRNNGPELILPIELGEPETLF